MKKFQSVPFSGIQDSIKNFYSLPKRIQNIVTGSVSYSKIGWKDIWSQWFQNKRSNVAWMIISIFYRSADQDWIRKNHLNVLEYRRLKKSHLSIIERFIAFLGRITVVNAPFLGPTTFFFNEEYRNRVISRQEFISSYYCESFLQSIKKAKELKAAKKAIDNRKKQNKS